MLQYVTPATPDGFNRVRPVLLDKGHRGLGNSRYRKRYNRLKRWWERPPPPRVVMRDAQVQMWPLPIMTPRHDPAPVPFWTESEDEGIAAGAIAG